jgi:hypothetical protein
VFCMSSETDRERKCVPFFWTPFKYLIHIKPVGKRLKFKTLKKHVKHFGWNFGVCGSVAIYCSIWSAAKNLRLYWAPWWLCPKTRKCFGAETDVRICVHSAVHKFWLINGDTEYNAWRVVRKELTEGCTNYILYLIAEKLQILFRKKLRADRS